MYIHSTIACWLLEATQVSHNWILDAARPSLSWLRQRCYTTESRVLFLLRHFSDCASDILQKMRNRVLYTKCIYTYILMYIYICIYTYVICIHCMELQSMKPTGASVFFFFFLFLPLLAATIPGHTTITHTHTHTHENETGDAPWDVHTHAYVYLILINVYNKYSHT